MSLIVHSFSFIAGVDTFPPLVSKCAPPSLPLSLLKRARATCQTIRTGRPGHSQVAARRGHVHAPYTSGVAVGLKGRYTHRELRWGRPTGSACVGVGDSTPLEAHPSGGIKKIETEGDPRCSRGATGRGEKERSSCKGQRSKPGHAFMIVYGALAQQPFLCCPFIRLPDFFFDANRPTLVAENYLWSYTNRFETRAVTDLLFLMTLRALLWITRHMEN